MKKGGGRGEGRGGRKKGPLPSEDTRGGLVVPVVIDNASVAAAILIL